MNQEAPSATNRLEYTSTSDLRTTEELLIKETIARQGGNLTQAAKQLGIARSTLYSRLAKEAKR